MSVFGKFLGPQLDMQTPNKQVNYYLLLKRVNFTVWGLIKGSESVIIIKVIDQDNYQMIQGNQEWLNCKRLLK